MKHAAETSGLILQAIEQTPETMVITTTDATIVYVNPAFERHTGYTRNEVLGKKASVLKSGVHTGDFYKELWGTLHAGKRWTGRITNRHKDGTLYTDEVRISPITGANGKTSHYLALRHDISREVQLEDQLRQAQKMESLGLLAGQLSHDFNNLLTVIIGSMELIIEELQPGSVGQRLSTEILRSSKESAGLIKQLMMFARKHDLRPVNVSLNEPVGELKVLLDNLLGKNVQVEYELAPDLVKVGIEPEHFKQAVMNLAVNARDALNGRGKIFLKTYTAGPDGLPPSLQRGRYGVFELSDSGPGIPDEILPRIFEPFFTTKPKGKGTGLGLSTVYGVVRQNGGQIFASNRRGGGAVFTIYFPASK